MKIVFRTDASSAIGSGHVMRCLTLASSLRERGAEVLFICRAHDGHLCDYISECGYTVKRLPVINKEVQYLNSPNYAAWLGASWAVDAEQTKAAIETLGEIPDWLIIDHYAIDKNWEEIMRTVVSRIMVIDDLADRYHDCDLLLDQNLVTNIGARYKDKVSSECQLLLGPKYAMLNPIYAELHEQIRPRTGSIKRIFIFFGGADSENVTGRALAAFLSLNRTDIDVDVVINSDSANFYVVNQQVTGYSNITMHSKLSTLAHLMEKADLAIGASGATSWERLCLGLPTLVVTLAENQLLIADELSKRGLIQWLWHQNEVSVSMIAQALDSLIRMDIDEAWSQRCLSIIDGKGVQRVCAALTVTANTPLHVRNARMDDENQMLEWANDPATRKNAFSSKPISATTHREWFHDRLRNSDKCRIYIVETTEKVAVGQVRFEQRNQGWEVDYALDWIFRGRGLGRILLEAALLKLRSDYGRDRIIGKVKINNYASRKVFESLGFKSKSITRTVIEYQQML